MDRQKGRNHACGASCRRIRFIDSNKGRFSAQGIQSPERRGDWIRSIMIPVETLQSFASWKNTLSKLCPRGGSGCAGDYFTPVIAQLCNLKHWSIFILQSKILVNLILQSKILVNLILQSKMLVKPCRRGGSGQGVEARHARDHRDWIINNN